MNIFVAFFVLLLLLAESTPPAASSIPLIGKIRQRTARVAILEHSKVLNIDLLTFFT